MMSMNRYSPVPPIKGGGKSSNNKNQKQETKPSNNSSKETNNNKNKMSQEEKFEDVDEDLDLNGQSLEKISKELERRIARLQKLTDFTTHESKQHTIYLNAACVNFGLDRTTGEKLGQNLTSANFVELYQSVWSKLFGPSLFEADTINETLLYNLLVLLQVIWNISDKSKTLCERILSINLHKDMFNYLSSDTLSPDNLQQLQEIKQIIVQGQLGTLHNVVQKATGAREAFRSSNAVDILQPFRQAEDFQMIACVALMIQSYLLTEEENEKLNSGSEVFELLVTLLECAIQRTSYKGVNFAVIEVLEVLNKLAANDNNKQRIVDSGALPYYVQLLQSDVSETDLAEAAHGIWTLAFKCKDRILQEDGCVDALKRLVETTQSEKVRKKAEGALWILQEQAQARPATARPPGDAGSKDDAGHVFISYQWDAKPTVLSVRDRLRKAGFKVWIDEDDMSGSVLEAMATAVEKATVVLVCLSQKYKESPSCRTEAEYTFRLRKPIIPLRLQPSYYPDGWLGALSGSKLVFDVSVQNKYEDSVKNLIKEISGHGKSGHGADTIDGIVPTVAPVTHAMPPPSHDKSSPIYAWKAEDITRWLENNNIPHLKSVFSSFDGATLLEYQSMRLEAPEAFFADLSHDGISRKDRLKLSKALKDLV